MPMQTNSYENIFTQYRVVMYCCV